MYKLKDDKVPFRLTFSLSPTLCSMLSDDLLNERFCAYLDEHPKLNYRNLGCYEAELVVPKDHRLACYSYRNPGQEDTELSISEMEGEAMVLMLPETVFGQATRNWFIRQGFIPRILTYTSNMNVLQKILEGAGIPGLLSRDNETRPLAESVVPIRLKDGFSYQVGVMWRKDMVLNPAMQVVIETLDSWH